MNKTQKALKLALEALEYPLSKSHEAFNVDMAELLSHRAITAIREALAEQPDQQQWCACEPTQCVGVGRCRWHAMNYSTMDKIAQQEPVAWLCKRENGHFDVLTDKTCKKCFPVYTTPPQRTWVGLTEVEVNEVLGGDIRDEPSGLLEFVRAIEAKLKEKNT